MEAKMRWDAKVKALLNTEVISYFTAKLNCLFTR
jgi:hypothetical protein